VRDLDPDLRPIGIYLIADYIWSQVRRNRRPRMLLIDEAWALMQHEEGAKFLASMARRARKYYLGLTTVTQDVEDFLATPRGTRFWPTARCSSSCVRTAPPSTP
jgi:type IV secretory pathway VirB4 component